MLQSKEIKLQIIAAASLAVSTLYGDEKPLSGVKNAGKDLFLPKVATHTP